jgi:hypothetical protein
VLTELTSLLRDKGETVSFGDAAELASARSILAAAETNPLAFRYSGAGSGGDPAIAVLASQAIIHLPGMETLLSNAPVAAFIVSEDMVKSIPLFVPSGKLLQRHRFQAHLDLAHRPLAGGTEMLWFVDALREFVLISLGPSEFLQHTRWHPNIRLRKEKTGGLLFVPETSQLVEFGPESFEAVQHAIALESPLLLAEAAVADLTAAIGALASAGAFAPLHRDATR